MQFWRRNSNSEYEFQFVYSVMKSFFLSFFLFLFVKAEIKSGSEDLSLMITIFCPKLRSHL